MISDFCRFYFIYRCKSYTGKVKLCICVLYWWWYSAFFWSCDVPTWAPWLRSLAIRLWVRIWWLISTLVASIFVRTSSIMGAHVSVRSNGNVSCQNSTLLFMLNMSLVSASSNSHISFIVRKQSRCGGNSTRIHCSFLPLRGHLALIDKSPFAIWSLVWTSLLG